MEYSDMRRIMFAVGVVIGLVGSAKGDEFADALNDARASRGLLPVVVLRGGEAVSANNNASQRTYGLGHWITGGFGQCSAIGVSSVEHALSMWTGSPSHAAMIYSPTLTAVGFAWDGWAASVATYQGPIMQSMAYQAVPPLPGQPMPAPKPLPAPQAPSKSVPYVHSPGIITPSAQATCPAPIPSPQFAPSGCKSGAGGCYQPRRKRFFGFIQWR